MNCRMYQANFIMGMYLPIKSYLDNSIQDKSYIDIDIVAIDIIEVSRKINSQAYARDNNFIHEQDKIIDPKQDSSPAISLAVILIIVLHHQSFNSLVRIAFINLLTLLEHKSLSKTPLFFVFIIFILVFRHRLCNQFHLLECFVLNTINIKDHFHFLPCRFLRSNLHQLRIA